MPNTDIGSAEASDLANATTDYEVDSVSTDGPQDQKETTYINPDWSQQLGYFKKTPKLKSAINTKCSWTVGKGFQADGTTTLILDAIKGFGKDTFNSIIENQLRVSKIGGDSFSEIITEDRTLINLKPIDPGVMRIVANRKGIIIRYEQINKAKKVIHKFKPEKIFHLSRNRTADEIHGESIIPAVEDIILMINEAMTDMKKLMHRHVIPRFKYSLDTDDPTKIAEFKRKEDAANAAGENIYIPQGAVEQELLAVPPNASLNPLPWIEMLTQHFFQAVGVPDIVMGGGSVSLTDASSKIKYLAFEQSTREEQKYLEDQIEAQLNLIVKFEMPAKLENDMMSGKPNEKGSEVNPPEEEPVQGPEPNDTTAEMEGVR